jgi:excinuclease ABC subunit A
VRERLGPTDAVRVIGARQHNLRGIDVAIPKGRLTVVTGVSGSGKSSLAFDTLYAEGQRRYVESFSTYARQFLERLDRPAVDRIEGLLPAVALEQENTLRSARATLGTLCDINDYLKPFFAAAGVLHCEVCGKPVVPDLPAATVDRLVRDHAGQRLVVTFAFHVGKGRDGQAARLFLTREGFGRALVEGRAEPLEGLDPTRDYGRVPIVVDRLVVSEEERARLVEALELAYRMGEDDAACHLGEPPIALTRARRCCGRRYPEPLPGLFSFGSPLGACPACNGFGRVMDFDLDRVVPDPRLSLDQGAIRPWAQGKRAAERRALVRWCDLRAVDRGVPFAALSPEVQRAILVGETGKGARWLGVRGWFRRLERKSYKMHVRILIARYRAYLPCEACAGSRFRPEALRVRLGGRTVAEVLALTVVEARAWLAAATPSGATGASRALAPVREELERRLAYLDRVGLGYLTLDRAGRTLSGGELQRANLTTAVGSGLCQTLFVLDEPSVGLHPRDAERLAGLLGELTARENTVVVVDHDPDLLRVADHVIELGPGPGAEGGQICYQGPPSGLRDAAPTPTSLALAARAGPRPVSHRDLSGAPGVIVRGARAHNLRAVDARFPYRALTVVSGVSGSGKTTLVRDVLHYGALRRLGLPTDPPGACDAIEGLESFEAVEWVGQGAPAATPRANPATYLGAWDGVRAVFAAQALSKERGYTAATFSFNTGHGRCPACQGAGFERVEMQFMAAVHLVCEACGGTRFRPEVREVRWQELSVSDVLELTADEASRRFGPRSVVARRLAPLAGVGLGYLRLGQPLSRLSGGEAQRLKIAEHLGRATDRPTLFLFDEPTTGLHLLDIERLIDNLRALIHAGHTVIAVEHHLDMIAAADHSIDLGPDAGEAGGRVVYQGPPDGLARAGTPTGQHLARWIGGTDPLVAAASRRSAPTPNHGGAITIEGARVHNLKDLGLRLPRDGRTIVSGVSGSGKSSLVFDLVFAEGQRRFLDCLSPYARQYLTQLSRPEVDRVAGIPPTVAVEQRTSRGGELSTVASATEIEPYLRLLYARAGDLPPGTDGRYRVEDLAGELGRRWPGRRLMLAVPAVGARKGFHLAVFARAARLGHAAILVDGEVRAVDPPPRLNRRQRHSIAYLLPQVRVGDRALLVARLEEAHQLGAGEVRVTPEHGAPRSFHLEGERGPLLDPRLFSPRTEIGACPACRGNGQDPPGTPCAQCAGERLVPLARSVQLGGARLPEVLGWPVPRVMAFFEGLSLEGRKRALAEGLVQAILERARFLLEVGLGYLSLGRPLGTLSTGEAQRVRLGAQLGAELSGVLYVLDEPTVGLHAADVDRLLGALDRLQAAGNGVLVVEHDEATLRTADFLVDLGPGAGKDGGEVLAAGTLDELLSNDRSITGRWLRSRAPRVRGEPRSLDGVGFLELRGVQHHNLREVDVRFPRGRLSLVTGVSGSGKSSLVHDVLIAALAPAGGPVFWRERSGFEGLGRLARIDADPIGKNPRSTPATYAGLWDPLRQAFASLPEAKLRGFKPSRFSYNVDGGRCETCTGLGQVKLEMAFLADAYVPCETCGGRRFNPQTRQVTWSGRSVSDVLGLSVSEALGLFGSVPQVARRLAVLEEVGLGYLELGQPSPTLSGGEAQRLKLAAELHGRGRHDTLAVLDEPSTGLHLADLPRLIGVLHRLVDAGATVVVVEHHPQLIREADWVVDLGPGAGDQGGAVVYQGPVEGLRAVTQSVTGAWLPAG